MHPIAVVELLWQSCCASESEKQQNSLTARLKVRQRTQLLVDHSLLLGSSSEGVHVHDIVLQYLRKRLSAEEMQAEQRKVVEGMVAASHARFEATGRVRGLSNTIVHSYRMYASRTRRACTTRVLRISRSRRKKWIGIVAVWGPITCSTRSNRRTCLCKAKI